MIALNFLVVAPCALIVAWLVQALRPTFRAWDRETQSHSLIVMGKVWSTKKVEWKVQEVHHRAVEYKEGLALILGSTLNLVGEALSFELAIRYLREYTEEAVVEVLTIWVTYPSGEVDRLDFTLLDDVPIESRINYCALKIASLPADYHTAPARFIERVCHPAVCLTDG